VFFLATRGLHLSIEFTGGTVIEVEYAQAAELEKVRGTVETLGFGEVQVQNFGTSRDVLIRLPVRGDVKQAEVVTRVFEALCKAESGAATSSADDHRQGRGHQQGGVRRTAPSRCSCSAASSSGRRSAPNWRATAPMR
jgi:preprotein translocase subunit SecF